MHYSINRSLLTNTWYSSSALHRPGSGASRGVLSGVRRPYLSEERGESRQCSGGWGRRVSVLCMYVLRKLSNLRSDKLFNWPTEEMFPSFKTNKVRLSG